MKRLLLLLPFIPALAWAQYPNKPIRMIVPFAPGGASDFVGRILQPRKRASAGTIESSRSAGVKCTRGKIC